MLKELTRKELLAKIEADGLVAHRPRLALAVLRGDTAYAERSLLGEEPETVYALAGSIAAHPVETRAEPVAPATREISDGEIEARLDRILGKRSAPTPTRPAPAPTADNGDPSGDISRAAANRAGVDLVVPRARSITDDRRPAPAEDASAALANIATKRSSGDRDSSIDDLFPLPPDAA